MDPLSVTASIIAIVELSGAICGFLYSLKGTSKDIAQCRLEISNVSNMLEKLSDRLDEASSGDAWFLQVQALAAANGPIEQYRSALEQLKAKLASSASSRTKIGSTLSWKFSKEEIADILTRIERLKSLTQIALEMDQFKLSQALKDETAVITSTVMSIQTDTTALKAGVKSIQKGQGSDEYRAIMKWLSPTDFPAQQSDVIGKRQKGTGKWFVESPQFTNFLQGENKILFCPGIPGAGKTMISAIAIDHIWEAFQGDNVGVAYIYNNYNRQEEQTATKLIAAILKQLVQGRPSYGEPVTALHKQHAGRGTRPSFDEIRTTIHSVLNNYSRAYIIIDALDECTDTDGTRGKLINAFLNLQTRTDTRLMVTSRFGSGAEDLLEGALELEIQANEADVKQYVAGRLDRFAKCVRNDKEIQAEIQDGIVQAVDSMFLLAPLHLDSLENENTKRKIRSGLKNLPRGSTAVNETYNQAIKRIERQPPTKSEQAKTVLSWITYAKRQLTTTELCHALAVEAGDLELDKNNIPDIDELISVCAGLVAVDKESNIIRLVHYTTQEYFKGIRETWNPKAQEEIASTCLTYLSFETFNTGHCDNDADFESRMEQNPFLDYAAKYWGDHSLTVQQSISELALPFLRNTNQILCSTQVIFVSDTVYRGYNQDVEKGLTGLHVAAYFGLAYLLQELTCSDKNKKCLHIDARDSKGRTPLSWAAMKGHITAVEWLVKQDNVVADSKDNDGRTPLSLAARRGHEAIVKLLVERHDVIADSKDNDNQTPLLHAAKGGHEAIVNLLVNRDDVVANSEDKYGRTPLLYAAIYGHEATVKLLVKLGDVVADLKDDDSRTPLSWAAINGHEAIVKLLVERDDVEADSKDDEDRTPFSWAASRGYEATVKLLVELGDVEADSKDNRGRTPLLYAAKYGREAIVKLLVKWDNVEADSKDNEGRTPLSWAASGGYKAIVKLLVELDNVEADSKDNKGRTPLSYAAENENEAIVELLLERNDVDPNSEDNDGCSLLWWAVSNYFWADNSRGQAVVKLLLERDVTPDSKDKNGQTPLSIAAETGNEEIIKLLLKTDDVDPNSADNDGHTPLWRAVENGYKDVVKLLIEMDDIIADLKDKDGRTPLSWAAAGGSLEIVRLLLERDDVDANSEDKDGHTPLWWATEGDSGSVSDRVADSDDDSDDDDSDDDGDGDGDDDGDGDGDDDGDNDSDTPSFSKYKARLAEELANNRKAVANLLTNRIAKDKEAQTAAQPAAKEGDAQTRDTTGKETETQIEKQTVQEGDA